MVMDDPRTKNYNPGIPFMIIIATDSNNIYSGYYDFMTKKLKVEEESGIESELLLTSTDKKLKISAFTSINSRVYSSINDHLSTIYSPVSYSGSRDYALIPKYMFREMIEVASGVGLSILMIEGGDIRLLGNEMNDGYY